eukprot:6473173-Amphidinium_carterae.1
MASLLCPISSSDSEKAIVIVFFSAGQEGRTRHDDGPTWLCIALVWLACATSGASTKADVLENKQAAVLRSSKAKMSQRACTLVTCVLKIPIKKLMDDKVYAESVQRNNPLIQRLKFQRTAQHKCVAVGRFCQEGKSCYPKPAGGGSNVMVMTTLDDAAADDVMM